MEENMGYGQKTLKDIVQKGFNDLTPHEHERALKGSYRSFVMPGRPKTDINSYCGQAKLHIKTLIEKQLKKIGPVKIIMTLCVIMEEAYKATR